MKKQLMGILTLLSLSCSAQVIDWNLISTQAKAMTNLELCFERVFDSRAVSSACNDAIRRARDVGVTKEEASATLFEISKYKVIAEKAEALTTKELENILIDLIVNEFDN